MLSITLVSAHSGRLAVISCCHLLAACPTIRSLKSPPSRCLHTQFLVFSESGDVDPFYQNTPLSRAVPGCTSSFVFQYLTRNYTATEMVYLLIYSPLFLAKKAEVLAYPLVRIRVRTLDGELRVIVFSTYQVTHQV